MATAVERRLFHLLLCPELSQKFGDVLVAFPPFFDVYLQVQFGHCCQDSNCDSVPCAFFWGGPLISCLLCHYILQRAQSWRCFGRRFSIFHVFFFSTLAKFNPIPTSLPGMVSIRHCHLCLTSVIHFHSFHPRPRFCVISLPPVLFPPPSSWPCPLPVPLRPPSGTDGTGWRQQRRGVGGPHQM